MELIFHTEHAAWLGPSLHRTAAPRPGGRTRCTWRRPALNTAGHPAPAKRKSSGASERRRNRWDESGRSNRTGRAAGQTAGSRCRRPHPNGNAEVRALRLSRWPAVDGRVTSGRVAVAEAGWAVTLPDAYFHVAGGRENPCRAAAGFTRWRLAGCRRRAAPPRTTRHCFRALPQVRGNAARSELTRNAQSS